MNPLAALKAAVPAGAARPRVYAQVQAQPPMAADAALTALIAAAGGMPFLINPGFQDQAGNLEVSWEELLEFDPQMVLYIIPGQGRRFDPAELLGIEGWDRSEAARERRVYSLDDALFMGPRQDLLAAGRLIQGLIAEAFWGGARLEHPGLRRLDDRK